MVDALVIGTTFLGSLFGAFLLQKAALEKILRRMEAERRSR